MATFKLGAIITDIAGSIGGTTLKRNGTYKVIMNKPSGSAYSRLLTNQALSYLGSIFKSWTYLSETDKNEWNAQALLYTFPDKFGTLRNISGRQLYIKLNAQRYQINPVTIDPSTLSSIIVPFVLNTFIYDISSGISSLTVNRDDADINTYLFTVEISTNPLRSPTFISRKTIHSLAVGSSFSVQMAPYILAEFPYWTYDYNTRVYVESINSSGFKSVMQSITMTVVP
jgi:hypothetical protein